ncbi:MAG TPA: GNAT family N-acetyltransferase [Pyrinomonadaceae bacterium]
MQVRTAAPGEAALIASVLLEAFVEYRDAYTPEAFAATTPAGDEVLSRMKEGPVWVATLGGEVVGTASAVARGGELYVRGMAVLPKGRGLGIGELLLREIEDYARAQGCARLTLSTTPFLHRAIRLYERFGFRRDEAGPHDLAGTPLFTMAKGLKGGESVRGRIILAQEDQEIQSCYTVMAELRPDVRPEEFLARVKRQSESAGYRLAYLTDGEVKAVAGFRISEGLAWGRFLYLDDLVTKSDDRSKGYGGELFDWLVGYARAEGCEEFHLNSRVQRFDAHRFYLNKRMFIECHHFALKLRP